MPIYEIVDDQHGTFAGAVRVQVEAPKLPDRPGQVPDPDLQPFMVTFIGHVYDTKQLRDDTPTLAANRQRIEDGLDAAVERCAAEAELKGWSQLMPGQIRYAAEQDRKVEVRESELEAMRARIAELEARGAPEDSMASVEVAYEPAVEPTRPRERVIKVTPKEAKALRENRRQYTSGPCEVCGKMVPLNSMIAHWRMMGTNGKELRAEHARRYSLYKATQRDEEVAV